MATGLMTLAYMAEMAMVFNLAYLELNKGRYIAAPKASVFKLRDTIAASAIVGNENDWIRGKTKIVDRLQKLASDDPKERQHSWYLETDKVKHSDWLACDGYEIFEQERDKGLCQHSLALSVLLLVGITVLDYKGFSHFDVSSWTLAAGLLLLGASFLWLGHFLYIRFRILAIGASCAALLSTAVAAASTPPVQMPDWSLSIWWLCFLFFLLTVLAPVVCIHFGRRVQKGLNESIEDARREFETLKAKALPK